MRKVIILMAACLLGAATAMAVPAKRVPTTITQSDGTKVTVTMMGDEWSHSYVTNDFKTVGIGKDGDVYYRTTAGLSNVRAHEFVQRNAAELSFLSDNSAKMGLGTFRKLNRRTKTTPFGPAKVGSTQVPTTGTPRVPVIVVEYSDKKCSNPLSTFTSTYTSGSNSVYQYFYDQSNGLYRPQYDVYGIYNLNKTRATYGGNDSSGNDVGVAQMVYDAVIASNADIDWTQYDNDGDGEADVVIVVYAGVGEAQASSTVPNSIWPCQWTLAAGNYYGDGPGSVTLDGITIDRFGVFNEINGSKDNGTQIDGIGTFCHEFSHCLGLPDFYDTGSGNYYYGIGSWSLMDYGSYNNNGYTPIGYNAYEKNFMGWISLLTPTENSFYTLPKFNQKSSATDIAYKVTSPLNSNEYYILENRAKQGWDQYITDEGMMVTHVTYISDRWSGNTVNKQAIQLFTIIAADNSCSDYDEDSDLFGESNHSLTDDSTPAAKLNMTSSGTLPNSGAGYMGKPLTEINLNSDGTVSFWYIKGNEPHFAPVLNDATNVQNTSFTASWTDETEAQYVSSYDLQVNEQGSSTGATLLNEEDLSSGATTNWTKSSSGTNNDGNSLRLGTTRAVGSITSPSLDLSSGTVTVIVNAKYYGTDTTAQLKISILNASGSELASSTISNLTSSFANYSVKLTGSFTTTSKVKLENVTKGKRVNLTNVKVYDGDATASNAALRASETGGASNRTITGITAKSYTVSGLNEGRTYNFKVRANYADGSQSDWTDAKSVTLLGEVVLNPFIVADDEVAFGEVTVGESSTIALNILAEELKDDVTLTLNDSNSVFSLASATVLKADAEAGAAVNVTFSPAAAQEYSATVTVSSQDAESVVVTLSGTGLPAKETPQFTGEATAVTSSSFNVAWNAVDYAASYTLDVTRTDGGDESYVYALVTDASDLADGDKIVIVSDSKGKAAGALSGTYLAAENVTVSNSVISELPDGVELFTLEANGTSWYLANNEGQYLTSTTAKTMSYSSSGSLVTISISGGDATISFGSAGRILYNNTSPRFTTYTSNTSASMLLPQIYKRVPASANASESGNEAHKVITGITGTDYTVEGLTAGATYSCKVKAIYLDETESEWSNALSVTLEEEQAVPTIVCTPDELDFGSVYTDSNNSLSLLISGTNLTNDITVAIEGDEYFSIDSYQISAAEAAEGVEINVAYNPTVAGGHIALITLSSEGAEDVEIYVFGNAEIEKLIPEVDEPDEASITSTSFVASWSAVPNAESYTLEVTQTSSASDIPVYSLVTDASDLADGDKIIIVSTASDKAAGALGNSVLGAEDVTISDGVISEISDDVEVFTLTADGTNWKLANREGAYLTTTAVKKLSYSDSGTSAAISISSGNATISFGSSLGRILYNASSPRFTTYTSNTSSSMLLPQIYKLTAVAPTNAAVKAYEPMTFTDITDTSYTVDDLEAGASYSYRVKAVYTDQTEGDWSDAQSVTVKNSTGIDAIAIDGTADAVWYDLRGIRLAGRPSATGVYIRIVGTKAQKVVVR